MSNKLIDDVIKIANVQKDNISFQLRQAIKDNGATYFIYEREDEFDNEDLYEIGELKVVSELEKELDELKRQLDKADCSFLRII